VPYLRRYEEYVRAGKAIQALVMHSPPARAARRRNGQFVVAAGLFLLLVFIRTRHISETFWLLGDQMRDWTIALGSWRDLPLTGAPSTVGGTAIGPVYYWMLWGIRHLVGPWTDNLPHAGGIGLSLLQSAADALLFLAIRQRFESPWLGLSATLFLATAPYDMALTATIWNPAVSVALVKATLALVLIGERETSTWWVAGTTALAWLAVQAHSSAIFVAGPLMASLVVRALLTHAWRAAAQTARAIVEVVVVLQIPLFVHLIRSSGLSVGPSRVIADVMQAVAHPETLRLRESFRAAGAGWNYILLRPWTAASFTLVVWACAALAMVRWRRDLTLVSATVVPLLAATGGYAVVRMPFDYYWLLTLMPSVVLTIVAATAAVGRAGRALAIAATLVAAYAVPARMADSMTIHRMPEYSALVRGTREIRHRTAVVRAIATEFPLPPTSDPAYLFRVLGGQVVPDAAFSATIGRSGNVTYRAE
jgi:hypothetical protein